ncbi:MAG: type II toxin-antitoxin system RelE/ParE family toxin [Pseudomonadota bacterium]
MEIIWSETAVHRVEEISRFIAKDSAPSASRFITRLIRSVERLKTFPLSGSAVPENIAFRQVVFQGYRIIYRLTGSAVQIVTVVTPGFSSDDTLRK